MPIDPDKKRIKRNYSVNPKTSEMLQELSDDMDLPQGRILDKAITNLYQNYFGKQKRSRKK